MTTFLAFVVLLGVFAGLRFTVGATVLFSLSTAVCGIGYTLVAGSELLGSLLNIGAIVLSFQSGYVLGFLALAVAPATQYETEIADPSSNMTSARKTKNKHAGRLPRPCQPTAL